MGHPRVVMVSGVQQVPHRAFSPIRNDKGFLSCERLKFMPCAPVVLPNP
ncbi:MAG: hypothetical protein JWQ87_4501 [Candidatus Sulfotelmatobacter sp.]|nr:hypothetical protein [Candidatus Sulfotelmatobacter sp.]